jgi:hypothetical protein
MLRKARNLTLAQSTNYPLGVHFLDRKKKQNFAHKYTYSLVIRICWVKL